MKSTIKVLAVSGDRAPTENFAKLKAHVSTLNNQKDSGLSIDSISLNGGIAHMNLCCDQLRQVMEQQSYDIVLVGSSSREDMSELEILAAKLASERNIPLCLFLDTRKVWGRYKKGGFLDSIAPLFTIVFCYDDDERKEICDKRIFVNTNLVTAGNPTHELAAFPSLSYEELRAELEIPRDSFLITIPFSKDPGTNITRTTGTLGALNELVNIDLLDPTEVSFLIIPHPGDQFKDALGKDGTTTIYQLLGNYGSITPKIFEPNGSITSFDVVFHSDLLIEQESPFIRSAAYGRTRILYYENYMHTQMLLDINGSIDRQSLREEIALHCSSETDAGQLILHAITDTDVWNPPTQRQKQLYKKPRDQNNALNAMASTLLTQALTVKTSLAC